MKAFLRGFAGVVVGLLLSFLVVVAVEVVSAVVHPPPEDFGGTAEEMYRLVEGYPAWVLAFVVAAWVAGAFVGAWTAKRIGGMASFIIVSLLWLTAVIWNVSTLPYPTWFQIASPLAILAALVGASRLVRDKVLGTRA